MENKAIREFANLLVRGVRDSAVQSCDLKLRADVNHIIANRWRAAGSDSKQVAEVLIPDIVDDTVMQLLRSIDEGILRLSFTSSDGELIELRSAGGGEMAGWYLGNGGWRAEFSSERFDDYFADLRLDE